MTKKDFQLIADIIKTVDDDIQRTWLAILFAKKLADTNPRFDKATFLVACNAINVRKDAA